MDILNAVGNLTALWLVLAIVCAVLCVVSILAAHFQRMGNAFDSGGGSSRKPLIDPWAKVFGIATVFFFILTFIGAFVK